MNSSGRFFRQFASSAGVLLLGACTSVGPDYERPDSPLGPDWYQAETTAFSTSPQEVAEWWQLFGDPELDSIVRLAQEANNSLEIAGLRVFQARAQLGLATGLQYPQTQVAGGGVTTVGASENAANTAAGDLHYLQYDLGVTASWEIDFWGRYRRGIEAADAAYLASLAAYEQATILVAAQVVSTYVAIRSIEEQIRITNSNITIQQRSYDIVDVQYRNGATSEIDVLQARTLLLSTQATLPALEADLAQARHALSALLGRAPGSTATLLSAQGTIPDVPEQLVIGMPADLLRQRPDVRQAEFAAMAANASVGLATADLYPSFTLSGTLGLISADHTNTTRTGETGIDELFSGDSLTFSAGPAFVWPFFNYGRIKNNIRVQDALLQQALTGYRETVIQAARDVEDAIAGLNGARAQHEILEQAVDVARRSSDVAMLRFTEGFADYQRVLDAQTALFRQQGRLVAARGQTAAAVVSLYLALGGGWQTSATRQLVPAGTLDEMRERTDWDDLLDETVRDAQDRTREQQR